MWLFSTHIWHNSLLLYHFYHLSGRNIYGAFILSEKVVFCDYMTWNADITYLYLFIRQHFTYCKPRGTSSRQVIGKDT
jgi:hypothetical protein